MPITLYSPSFTSNPRNAVKTEYSRPTECGNASSCVSVRELPPPLQSPRPRPIAAVVHSPTPSTVRMAASSNGELKSALAACEAWCSTKRMREASIPRRSRMYSLIHSLSEIQRCMPSRKSRRERGKVARMVVNRRSAFTKGFS